jgi:signal transduction histidine kinase
MPKAKYKNRLEKLFSNIDPVDPKPCLDEHQDQVEISTERAAPLPIELLDDLSLVGSDKTASEGMLEPVKLTQEEEFAGPGRLDEKEEKTNDRSWADFQSGGPEIQSVSGTAEWGEFLDGIRHNEQMTYVYDRTSVKELNAGEEQNISALADESNFTIKTPIQVSGEEIGKLLLEADPNRQLTDEDIDLVNAVAQQLAQQVETLRLLDEAQRSRGAAEQALGRLSRQGEHRLSDEINPASRLPSLRGWSEDGTSLGFEVDSSGTLANFNPDLQHQDGEDVLSAPIRVGDMVLGELRVNGDKPLSLEEEGLVDVVTQRLSQQVENLRLLEDARHFRSETEETIRRLTYQSWQAYLTTAAETTLSFEYKHSRVLPLEPSTGMPGKEFPLRVREEIIGQLAVDSPMVEQDDTASLVNVIGERLSAHLDGLRLAEQREQALAETEMMYSISARLSTAQSLEDALASVSEPAREAGARDSRLFFITLDERGQPEGLTLAAIWYPEDGPQIVPVSAHFLLSDYPAYWQILLDPGNPMLISDIFEDPTLEPETRELFIQTSARAAAVLPLAISGRWVGVIFINWEHVHNFSEQENRLYASLSRQAAVVVNNRLLLEQTRKRAQELQTVAQVSIAASTVLDPQELLQSVVDLTKSSFSLYHVQVYLNREKEGFLEVVAGSGEIGRQIAHLKTPVPIHQQTTATRAARERQVIIINDTQNEPGLKVNPLLPEVRAEMALPMIVGERMLGVFNVQSNTANRFTRDDARTYTTLSSQVAVALQNAELYAEQSATVERLRELDHLKSAFLANMSHELRTPLNSILGFAEVLLLELDGPLNDTMNNDIRLIEKNGKHLLSLINDVLDMAKIEAGKMNLAFEKFLLRELLEETMDITSSLAREKSLYLVIAPESQDRMNLVADRVRIRQVLINVVANAVKFTEKGGITLCVVQYPEERKLHLQIRDTGIGIPPDKLETVFESFSQVDTSTTRKAGGTGLGLPISRRLVEMHGGRLWAESSGINGQGSVFIIELPFEATKRNI